MLPEAPTELLERTELEIRHCDTFTRDSISPHGTILDFRCACYVKGKITNTACSWVYVIGSS